jgi:hypothetical protein
MRGLTGNAMAIAAATTLVAPMFVSVIKLLLQNSDHLDW